jgi:hypothetical protein
MRPTFKYADHPPHRRQPRFYVSQLINPDLTDIAPIGPAGPSSC